MHGLMPYSYTTNLQLTAHAHHTWRQKSSKRETHQAKAASTAKKIRLLQQTARWMYRLVSELSHPPAAPSYEALGVIVLWEINGCSEFLASSNCGDRANSK